MKTYVVTLGCPKNLVDSEASISLLQGAGCTMTDDPEQAELLIVSACSFLEVAWRETLDEVHRMGDVKARHPDRKLVLMGCLPRHRNIDLRAELPFVDRFVPAGTQSTLPAVVASFDNGRSAASVSGPAPDPFAGFERRPLLTPPHMAYVKIAEGCDRTCTFCAIPAIRGAMISRPVASVVREVEGLIERGVKEISLLAQDITSYKDGRHRFPDLVDAISRTGIDWIRIFYLHPGSLTIGLVRRLFEHPAVCRYLECPVQHASDRILARMGRPYTRARLEKLLFGLRDEFPDLRVRSEVIVGFPGEQDEDYDDLKAFVEAAEFASLGIFSYSPEPNTRAADMDRAVPESLASERAAELADLQQSITFAMHTREKGKRHRVLVDREVGDDDPDGYRYAGRYYGQAFEVDGEVQLRADALAVGTFVDVRVTDSDVFDLRGVVL